MENVDISRYNTPIRVTTFSEETGRQFLEKIKMLGFYTWKDRYATTDIICDGGSECVTVYFGDGTVKSTSIYYEYPPNYDKILTAFEQELGAKLYLG